MIGTVLDIPKDHDLLHYMRELHGADDQDDEEQNWFKPELLVSVF